jgi:RHS repeat-associated protein
MHSTVWTCRSARRRAMFGVALLMVAQLPLITNVRHADAATYSATVLADSPLVYYRFDEAGGPTANDSSPHAVNGTYQAGVTFGVPGALIGDSDAAVSSSGAGAAVTAPDGSLPSGNASRTVEAWLKTAATNYQTILYYGGSNAPLSHEDLTLSPDGLSLNVTFGGQGVAFTLPYALNDNRWHHLAVVYDSAGILSPYIDGAVIYSAHTAFGPLNTVTGAGLLIGSGTYLYTGSLDEVAIYPSALTAAQLRTHWRIGIAGACLAAPTTGYAGAVATDGPARYYRLGETSGRAALDSSGNCGDGAYEYDTQHVPGPLVGDANGAAGSPFPAAPMAISSDDGLPTGNSARTVEAWFKTHGTSSVETVVGYGLYGNEQGEHINLEAATTLTAQFGNEPIRFTTPYSLFDNRWHELAAVYDGAGNVSAYVDGQVINTLTLFTNGGSLNTTTGYGLEIGGGDAPFNGSIDEVAIYPTALSAGQLRTHWRVGIAGSCRSLPATGYGAVVAADQPNRYYRVGESAGRSAGDYSGNCRNGAYNYDAVRAVGGVTLDGDGAVRSALSPSPMVIASDDSLPLGNSARTVEAWFTTPGVASGYEGVVAYGWLNNLHGFEIDLSSAYSDLQLNFGNGNTHYPLATSVFDNRWHQVAAVWDGAGHEAAFVDGQQIGAFNFNPLSTTAGYGMSVGDTPGAAAFTGSIDEVAIYPTALSAARISAHYHAVKPTGSAPAETEELGGGSLCYKCLQRQLHHAVRVQPIDTENGNMYHTFTDFDIPGRGNALLMARTYNSMAAAVDSGLGFGWVDNYGTKLTATGPVSVSGSTATVVEENGAQTVFTSNGTAWTAPPRVIATLASNPDGSYALTRDLTQTLTFNAAGQLATQKDPNGYTTSLSYLGGQLSTVTDEAGRTLTFGYTGAHVSSLTDLTGRQVRYQYNDGLGNLTDVFDVNNGHWIFGYDSSHRLLTMQDPAGNVVTTHYDSQGRADWQEDGKLQKTTFAYAGSQTTVTDPMQNVTIDYYSQGLRVAETRGAGTPQAATWHYAYDPDTLSLTQVSDPNGNATTYAYDSQANLLSRTDALGRQTQYQQYNSFNEPQVIIDGKNVATTLGYDATGNLHTVSTPLVGSLPLQTQTTVYNHNDANHPGDVTSVVDPDGKTWLYGYDQYGDRASVTDPLGDQTSFTYNSVGWLLSGTMPRGNVLGCGCAAQFTTTYSYLYPNGTSDEYGDPQTITGPPGPNHVVRVTTMTYDADRNLHTQADADGHPPTVYLYDADNQLYEVDRADGSKLSTVYNADGTVHQQIDYQQIGGAANATTYGYDARARVTSVADPLNRTTIYGYDGAGNLISKVDPQGQTTTSTYDAANQLVGIAYSDGATPSVTNITYDGDGQRTGMSDGIGPSVWVWDSLRRVAQSTDGYGKTTQYGYDLKGQLTSIVYPGGHTVQRHYDDAGRMDWVQDWLGNKTRFTPDQDSNITGVAYPNGTSATMVPDETDHITSITDTAGGISIGYGRDPLSQVTSVTTSGLSDTHTYGYTPLNQVGQVDGAGTYTYDAADNPTGFPDNTVQTFDSAHQLGTTARISLIGTGQAEGSATSHGNLPITFQLPQGPVQSNDLILVAITVPSIDAASVQTPAGYSVVASEQTVSGVQQPDTIVFARMATGGESSVSINTGTVPYQKTAVAAIYRGVAQVEVTTAGQAQNTNSVPVGTVTTAIPGDRLVLVEGAAGNTSAQNWSTSPTVQSATMTDRVHESDMRLSATALADGLAPAAGTYGPGTASFGTPSTSANLVDILLALKPATTAYTFDSRGNRTSVAPPYGAAATTLAYDQANRLIGYGGAEAYAYNGDGLRMTKTPPNGSPEQFTYDVVEGLPLLLQDGSTQFVDGPGGQPLEQVTPQQPISLEGSAGGSTAATSVSAKVSVVLPGTIKANDEIVLGVTFPKGAGNSVKTPPPNYAQSGSPIVSGGTNPNILVVYTKKADGSESGQTVTVTLSAPSAIGAVAAVYRGVDPNAAIDVSATNSANGGFSVSPTSTANTTRYSGDEWVIVQGASYVGTSTESWSAPAGMHEESPQGTTATVSAGLADELAASPGSVGTLSSQFPVSAQLTAMFIAFKTPPQISYFHQDQLGSTRLLTDQAGTVVGSFTYDPYGNLVASGGTTTTPLLYAGGQYRDAETGLYYLRARYYDPATAQFLSRDRLEALTRSPYGYVNDNPLNGTDPIGLWPWDGLCLRNPFGGNNDNGGCHTTLNTSEGVAGVVAGGAAACALVTAGICGAVGLTAPDVEDEVAGDLAPTVVEDVGAVAADDAAAAEPATGACSRFAQHLRDREGVDGSISRIIKTESNGQTMSVVHQVIDVTGQVIHQHYKFLRGA